MYQIFQCQSDVVHLLTGRVPSVCRLKWSLHCMGWRITAKLKHPKLLQPVCIKLCSRLCFEKYSAARAYGATKQRQTSHALPNMNLMRSHLNHKLPCAHPCGWNLGEKLIQISTSPSAWRSYAETLIRLFCLR